MKKRIIIFLAVALFSAVYAKSNMAGRYGVHFSYGGNALAGFETIESGNNALSAVGGIYHIIDLVAVSPWLGFNNTSYSYENSPGSIEYNVSISQMYFGVDVPIYLYNFDKIKLAVVPGFHYINYKKETKATTLSSGDSTTTTDSDRNAIGFLAHAQLQYPMSRQLHLFARMGVNAYKYNDGDKTKDTSNGSRFTLGRTTLGITFYLK